MLTRFGSPHHSQNISHTTHCTLTMINKCDIIRGDSISDLGSYARTCMHTVCGQWYHLPILFIKGVRVRVPRYHQGVKTFLLIQLHQFLTRVLSVLHFCMAVIYLLSCVHCDTSRCMKRGCNVCRSSNLRNGRDCLGGEGGHGRVWRGGKGASRFLRMIVVYSLREGNTDSAILWIMNSTYAFVHSKQSNLKPC